MALDVCVEELNYTLIPLGGKGLPLSSGICPTGPFLPLEGREAVVHY